MFVLGIETSCDETGISLLQAKGQKLKIVSNLVASQVKLHAKYGGVYPFLAKREHQKNLPIVFKKATKKISKIDLIGVTVGPGLEPCLWQGISFGKNLAEKLKKPLIPINHIEAHLFVNFIENLKPLFSKRTFPAVGLVVSGGHTQLILIENLKRIYLLGETRDDAAGECLDKIARLLGLGYPGGPAIEKLAKKFKTPAFKLKLPRPMIYHKNFDFSFAGLKTAVLYDFKKRKEKERRSKEYIFEMAKEVQEAIIDVLTFKTIKAAKEFLARSIILGGGVVANEKLRNQFKEKVKKEIPKVKLFLPEKEFCTDNGLMVAFSAWLKWKIKDFEPQEEIKAQANLKVKSLFYARGGI